MEAVLATISGKATLSMRTMMQDEGESGLGRGMREMREEHRDWASTLQALDQATLALKGKVAEMRVCHGVPATSVSPTLGVPASSVHTSGIRALVPVCYPGCGQPRVG